MEITDQEVVGIAAEASGTDNTTTQQHQQITASIQHAGKALSHSTQPSTLLPDFALELASELHVIYERITIIDQRRRKPQKQADIVRPVSFSYPFEDVSVLDALGPAPKIRLIAPSIEATEKLGAEMKELRRIRKIMSDRAAARRAGTGWKLPTSSPTGRSGVGTGSIPGTDVGAGVRKLPTGPDGALAVSASPFFQTVTPLMHFRDAQAALDLLSRLATDRGIQTVMSRHNLTVNVLSELDPASATSQSGTATCRTLGLNRNGGETIWLRLRTDLYDGWRTYKDIRRTLCHELAHNRHQDHSDLFWTFCRQLVREVEKADYWQGGRLLGGTGSGKGSLLDEYDDEDGDDFEAADGDDTVGNRLYQGGSSRVGGDEDKDGEGRSDEAEIRRRRAAAAEERLGKLRRHK